MYLNLYWLYSSSVGVVSSFSSFSFDGWSLAVVIDNKLFVCLISASRFQNVLHVWAQGLAVIFSHHQLVCVKKKKRRPQRSYIINTNLDTMIRLIYMISILIIIYMYTSYIYIHMPMGNRLLLISIGVWIQQSQGWHDRVPVTLSTARNRA